LEETRQRIGCYVSKISKLCNQGKIKRTRTGYYLKESVDKYIADIEERKRITKPDWIRQGSAP
jgi:predicted DNA-binding protein